MAPRFLRRLLHYARSLSVRFVLHILSNTFSSPFLSLSFATLYTPIPYRDSHSDEIITRSFPHAKHAAQAYPAPRAAERGGLEIK